jgi:LacI family transcriptional regulator
MPRNATITDIAAALKVSAGTVSRALNGHPAISKTTRQKVEAMATQLNYRVNRVASSLRSGQTGIIGVIIPSAAINFFGSVVHGIEASANAQGYQVLIYQSDETEERERKGIEVLLQARVDGILLSIAKGVHNYDHLLAAKRSAVPIVLFDRVLEDAGFDTVTINDFEGARMATQHLIETGRQRIAHITGPLHLSIAKARLNGYKAALRENGLPFDKKLVQLGDISIETGRHAMQKLLDLSAPPDALFAVEDFTALGAMQLLKEKGIDVPAEFSVVGFANEAFGQYITPTLSSVDQQTIKMGEQAFLLLKDLISTSGKKKETAVQKVLDALPVFRESSALPSKSGTARIFPLQTKRKSRP